MQPSHATELAAAAAAALERLDLYLDLLGALLRNPRDPSFYQRNLEAFDAMRALTASLPHVRICWVELLISRIELLDALGRSQGVDDADGRIARLRERHLEALECFRRHCWDYIGSNLAPQTRAERARGDAGAQTALEIVQRRMRDAQRRLKRQREVIERLEASGADATAAHKVLGTMQDALDGMSRILEAARHRSG